jgi:hypothetical protein
VTAPPPFPLEVGLAWEGTSPEFSPSAWKNTKGDIPLLEGDVFQVRFVNTHLGPYDISYNPTPAWRINEVRFTNVTECVPEPGTLALLGIGGGLLVLARLRRTPRGRALGRSTVMGVIVAMVGVAAALALPPPVKADVLFDFQINSNGNVPGVTWSGTYQPFTVPLNNSWKYFSSGDKRWGVLTAGVDGPKAAYAAHLTSSTFSGIVDALPAQNARISLAHNFFLPPSGTGGPRPIALGQLQYQINNSGTWVGLPLAAFTSGSSVKDFDPVFGYSPFYDDITDTVEYVDQTAFVAPTYVTSTTAPLLSYVAPGGASFVGKTTGWSSLYVPSQAFLNINTGLDATAAHQCQPRRQLRQQRRLERADAVRRIRQFAAARARADDACARPGGGRSDVRGPGTPAAAITSGPRVRVKCPARRRCQRYRSHP